MKPENLYNQLRFNLDQPYSINKLSVRHAKPGPITIEKAGPNTALPQTHHQKEDRGNQQLDSSTMSRLQAAQFLAQRRMKLEKDESVQKHFIIL